MAPHAMLVDSSHRISWHSMWIFVYPNSMVCRICAHLANDLFCPSPCWPSELGAIAPFRRCAKDWPRTPVSPGTTKILPAGGLRHCFPTRPHNTPAKAMGWVPARSPEEPCARRLADRPPFLQLPRSPMERFAVGELLPYPMSISHTLPVI